MRGDCRSKVHRRASRIFLGRLQAQRLLPIVERHSFQAVEGESAQIHLHVLGVVYLDAIQEHAHVLAAQAAHVHGLEATHAAIVLDLNARETAEKVGHAAGRSRKSPDRHLFHGTRHGELLHGIDAGSDKTVCLLGAKPGSRQPC